MVNGANRRESFLIRVIRVPFSSSQDSGEGAVVGKKGRDADYGDFRDLRSEGLDHNGTKDTTKGRSLVLRCAVVPLWFSGI